MSNTTINTKKSFNLPAYINIPQFLYLDDRFDKAALLIAGFFYSIHTSGLKIKASTDYLCGIANIHKRQLYYILNDLEKWGYILRTGFTNRKITKWIYSPESKLEVTELDTSALECTSVQQSHTSAQTNVQKPHTSAVQCTKLVQSSALNWCTTVHTYTKEDTKDNKLLTTVRESDQISSTNQTRSSSSFFSPSQKQELLIYKVPSDNRTPDEFLSHCEYHIDKQDNANTRYQRFIGLKHILIKLHDNNDIFKARGYEHQMPNRKPTEQDFNNYKFCVEGYDWVGRWLQQQKQQQQQQQQKAN